MAYGIHAGQTGMGFFFPCCLPAHFHHLQWGEHNVKGIHSFSYWYLQISLGPRPTPSVCPIDRLRVDIDLPSHRGSNPKSRQLCYTNSGPAPNPDVNHFDKLEGPSRPKTLMGLLILFVVCPINGRDKPAYWVTPPHLTGCLSGRVPSPRHALQPYTTAYTSALTLEESQS